MIRIGNCSGYYGDRLSAMREMLEGGQLDYLTGDYLAELTMLILGRDKLKDSTTGYAKTFLAQVNDCAELIASSGVKIVSNAGGLNPHGLADKLHDSIAAQGLDLKVAVVSGDDVLDQAEAQGWGTPLTANAYLGAFGIAEALKAGADIVVTGRVTDASVVAGPAIAAHGWQREDFNELAGAVVAGHIIECGTQATGGNFSGFADIDRSGPLGFPIAEIAADGSSVITKHAGTAGSVTTDTVTAQLVYEIQDELYLNPDVTVHLDSVQLSDAGTDRVAISPVRGSAPPPQTKVCLNELAGYANQIEFVLTGLDIDAKAEWLRAQLEAGLAIDPPEDVTWHLDRGDMIDPLTQAEASARLRCHVKSTRSEPVGTTFTTAAISIGLASIPGFYVTAPPRPASPYGRYRVGWLDQTAVAHHVDMPDGQKLDIAPPSKTGAPRPSDHNEPAVVVPLREPVEAPLGLVLHARSGDKGGNANLGLWVSAHNRHAEEIFDWLRGQCTESWVHELLAETQGHRLTITALPALRAINIVVEGLLGEGVASSTRLDAQAKALGEWARARFVTLDGKWLS